MTMWSSVTFSTSFCRKPEELLPISYERYAAIGSPSWLFVCLFSFMRSADVLNKIDEKISVKRRAGKWWDRRIGSEKKPTHAEAACRVMAKWLAGHWTLQGVSVCVKSWQLLLCLCAYFLFLFYSERVHLLKVCSCCLRVCQSEDSYCSSSYSRGPSR